MANIDIVRIAYKGSAAVIANLMANEVQVAFSSVSTGMPHVATGRRRVLGVANTRPSPLAPDVPTIASSRLPGFEVAAAQCMWVPAGTPNPVVNQLSEAMLRALATPERHRDGVAGTPEQTAAYIRNDIVKWAKLVKEANLRLE